MALSQYRIDAHAALPAAGFLATAVAFGPARMGFGLFLPVFRDSFRISTETAGLIAAATFAAFLAALPAGMITLNRYGPRLPVLLGGAAATAGLALVAGAADIRMLTAGLALAASSAGLCWTPYNNAVERIVERDRRTRALSIISTGTTLGTAAAAALALAVALTGFDWRVAWILFALTALAMTLANLGALRPVARTPGGRSDAAHIRRALQRPETLPLVVAALSFGLTSTVYLSFAVDRATTAGALAYGPLDSAAPFLFVSFGIAGLIGLATGDIEDRIGLLALLRGLFLAGAASFALIAFLPGEGWAVLLSAGLQGAVIMMMSAVFSFWSARLFANIPSVSFTVVLTLVAAGNVVGPALAGWAAASFGLMTVFAAAAGVSLATPLLLSPALVEQASSRPWRESRRSRTIYAAPESGENAC